MGTILGSMFAGIPGDRYGRRDSLRIMAVFYTFSALGCAFAWNWYSLVFFRLIGGLGIGGSWRFGWWSVCVTRGKYGCSLLVGEQYQEVRGYEVPVADAIGAGDAFSAAFFHGLDAGWSPARIGDFANRLGAFVASPPGAVAEWSLDRVEALTRSSST